MRTHEKAHGASTGLHTHTNRVGALRSTLSSAALTSLSSPSSAAAPVSMIRSSAEDAARNRALVRVLLLVRRDHNRRRLAKDAAGDRRLVRAV